ncbi:MAG TPA: hypothetical protein VHD56_14865 [Tepidisphaeraceae bacterium]|nr:hypothetical protein [Tepidisphaeraceae bacterium]
MFEKTISLPQLGLIAGTRAALGAGAGLLLADRLSRQQRRSIGMTLLAVGILTTFPLVADLVSRNYRRNESVSEKPVDKHEPEPALLL